MKKCKKPSAIAAGIPGMANGGLATPEMLGWGMARGAGRLLANRGPQLARAEAEAMGTAPAAPAAPAAVAGPGGGLSKIRDGAVPPAHMLAAQRRGLADGGQYRAAIDLQKPGAERVAAVVQQPPNRIDVRGRPVNPQRTQYGYRGYDPSREPLKDAYESARINAGMETGQQIRDRLKINPEQIKSRIGQGLADGGRGNAAGIEYGNGGKVRGPGGPTADKVGPVMLSDSEYVLPADTVEAMGGAQALDKIRAATHKFVDPANKPAIASGIKGLKNGGLPGYSVGEAPVEEINIKSRAQMVDEAVRKGQRPPGMAKNPTHTPALDRVSSRIQASNATKAAAPAGRGARIAKGLGLTGLAMEGYHVAKDSTTEGMDGMDVAARIAEGAGRGAGAYVGATGGAALGALGGPLAPLTVPLGTVAGGALGYFSPDLANSAYEWATGRENQLASEKAAELRAAGTPAASPQASATPAAQAQAAPGAAATAAPGQGNAEDARVAKALSSAGVSAADQAELPVSYQQAQMLSKQGAGIEDGRNYKLGGGQYGDGNADIYAASTRGDGKLNSFTGVGNGNRLNWEQRNPEDYRAAVERADKMKTEAAALDNKESSGPAIGMRMPQTFGEAMQFRAQMAMNRLNQRANESDSREQTDRMRIAAGMPYEQERTRGTKLANDQSALLSQMVNTYLNAPDEATRTDALTKLNALNGKSGGADKYITIDVDSGQKDLAGNPVYIKMPFNTRTGEVANVSGGARAGAAQDTEYQEGDMLESSDGKSWVIRDGKKVLVK